MSTENKPTPALYAGVDPLDLDETARRLTITLDGLTMLYNEVSTWFDKDTSPEAFSVASRWASVIFLLDDNFPGFGTIFPAWSMMHWTSAGPGRCTAPRAARRRLPTNKPRP